jgi:TDG/mug DNA glycosylase family protein
MLEDVIAPSLALVVCGSAVGAQSAIVGHYYAGPGNRFWRTLHLVGLTPRQLDPTEAPLLLYHGIGLTDLVKFQAGSDAAIRFGDADAERLRATILRYAPRVLCFNGLRAAREYLRHRNVGYGLRDERIGATVLFVAPSTSGAANASWDLARWHELALMVRTPQP